MALKWKDINLKEATADIHKTVADRSEEGGWKLSSPKTFESNRVINMPKLLTEQMQKYKEYCQQFENFNEDCFVFGLSRPLPFSQINSKYAEYLKIAKVKKIKIHDLRHSHASLLINNGASVLVVSKRLGHSNTRETLNTYSHMFPDKEKEVVELINNL